MNRNRLAIIIATCALLPAMTACTERTKENMEPTGEVVEVNIPVPDTLQHPASQVVEEYSLPDTFN